MTSTIEKMSFTTIEKAQRFLEKNGFDLKTEVWAGAVYRSWVNADGRKAKIKQANKCYHDVSSYRPRAFVEIST